jgi:hypothetical protein
MPTHRNGSGLPPCASIKCADSTTGAIANGSSATAAETFDSRAS